MVTEKTCTGPCGETKPISGFYSDTYNALQGDGLWDICRVCWRAHLKSGGAPIAGNEDTHKRDLRRMSEYQQRNWPKVRVKQKEWRGNNRERSNSTNRDSRNRRVMKPGVRERLHEFRRQAKRTVFEHYGNARCGCCGESSLDMLTLDHINNDGGAHRRQIGRERLFMWARKNGYPPIFQVMCFNCNVSKHLNGGQCSHQIARLELVA